MNTEKMIKKINSREFASPVVVERKLAAFPQHGLVDAEHFGPGGRHCG